TPTRSRRSAKPAHHVRTGPSRSKIAAAQAGASPCAPGGGEGSKRSIEPSYPCAHLLCGRTLSALSSGGGGRWQRGAWLWVGSRSRSRPDAATHILPETTE